MYCVLLPRSLSHSFLIDVIYMGEVSRLLHFFSDAISTAENAGRDHTSCSQTAPTFTPLWLYIIFISFRRRFMPSKCSYSEYN